MNKTLLVLAACAMLTGSADAAMYLVGDPAGKWNPTQGIEMEEVDGGYKWTGTVDYDQWFAFATQLCDSDDWGTFNSTYRLNPATNGISAETGTYTLELGGADRAFRGTGSEVTYFVQQVDDVYTLTVTEDVITPPLYIIGQIDGNEWSPMIGVRMKTVDGGWEWSGFVSEKDYFAFATQLMDEDDWDTFNANYRISPSEEYIDPVAEVGQYDMHLGSPEGAFHGTDSKVKYFVQKVDDAYTLTVSEVKEENPWPENAVWGVVGSFNTWGENPDFQMTEIRPGVWKATMYDFSGSFKFRANENWEYNFGADSQDSGEDTMIEADGVYNIVWGGGDFNIPEEIEEVIFELDLNKMTLTVDGLTPTFLALRGNFIDWAFEWSYLFQEVEDDVYMLYLDGIDKEWRFKIADQEWTEFYTTGVTDMTAGEIYPLGDPNGADMGVDKNYTDVTLFLNLDEGYFSFYGEVISEVASMEITQGKSRYFNLQGVEVTNPSKGLYIRVCNGKSEKISVK